MALLPSAAAGSKDVGGEVEFSRAARAKATPPG
jgi:hypothetical protein